MSFNVSSHVCCGAIAALLATFTPAAFAQTVRYVDDDAPAGGNGLSWATAYNDLQAALAAAQTGDEIRIAQGVYTPAPPNGSRNASFNLVNGVTLRGGYAGIGTDDPDTNDPAKFETILSGDLNGNDGPDFANYDENSYHVVRADATVTRGTALLGLTIAGGNASEFDGVDSQGAGLSCQGEASLAIQLCSFRHNRARNGGGIFAEDGALHISDCLFLENLLVFSSTGFGAGIFTSGPLEVTGSRFEGNRAMHGGGGVSATLAKLRGCTFINNYGEVGGGVQGGQQMIDCVFHSNEGFDFAGGAASSGLFVNCTFSANTAFVGAAVWGSPTLVNCVFMGNLAFNSGGAVSVSSEATIINSTIIGNEAQQGFGGGILMNAPGTVQITNCVVSDNTATNGITQQQQIQVFQGTINISNSCVEGWNSSLGGTGNFGHDPKFIDAAGPDGIYGTEDDNPRLRANSPLINRGSNAALPADEFDLDDDGETTEPIPVDLDGLPRIVGGTVDIGAYEFQGQPCLADTNGDGSVGVPDLLTIISAWGACVSGSPCNHDLNLDNNVGVPDLLFVIGNWGTCP